MLGPSQLPHTPQPSEQLFGAGALLGVPRQKHRDHLVELLTEEQGRY